MWDYLAFFTFLIVAISITYKIKALRSLPSAGVYLLGMTIVLLLDSYLPFDALGPFEIIVSPMLYVVAAVIRLSQLGSVAVLENTMTLSGARGSFQISVFWPSAGVHSMIIYSLLILLFLVRIRTTMKRRILYFSLGAIGTFLLNLLRIFALALYVLLVTTDFSKFEEFHATIGEIMFLPWILTFAYLVGKHESSIASIRTKMPVISKKQTRDHKQQ